MANGNTALHQAVLAGQWPEVQKLLTTQPHLTKQPNENGQLPIQMVYGGRLPRQPEDIYDTICSYSDYVYHRHPTPYIHYKTFNALLKQTASAGEIDRADHEGWTLLHDAVWRAHWPLVTRLLSHGANVHCTTNNGLTPLSLAAAPRRHNWQGSTLTAYAFGYDEGIPHDIADKLTTYRTFHLLFLESYNCQTSPIWWSCHGNSFFLSCLRYLKTTDLCITSIEVQNNWTVLVIIEIGLTALSLTFSYLKSKILNQILETGCKVRLTENVLQKMQESQEGVGILAILDSYSHNVRALRQLCVFSVRNALWRIDESSVSSLGLPTVLEETILVGK